MKPPRHFTLILGRKAHLALGNSCRTLCGRDLGDQIRRDGLTAREAKDRADCKVCRGIVRVGVE